MNSNGAQSDVGEITDQSTRGPVGERICVVTQALEQNGALGGETTLLPSPRGGARTWYEVLDIGDDASLNDVVKAYERALSIVEGRSIGGYLMLDPMAAESARADVEAAFAILGDAQRRSHYDRSRGATTTPPAAAHHAHDGREQAEARALLAGRTSEHDIHDSPEVGALPRNSTPVRFLSPLTEPAGSSQQSPTLRIEAPLIDSDEELHFVAAIDPVGSLPAPRAAPLTATATTLAAAGSPAPQASTVAAGTDDSVFASMPPQGTRAVSTLPTEAAAKTPELPPGAIDGAMIKELRVGRGLSLQNVADATKIRKEYLTAIEEEDVPSLPARVYLRGFLTQISRVLKVDRAHLAEGYLQNVESKDKGQKD